MVIVGAGRIGTALAQRAEAVGAPVSLVGRGGDRAPLEAPQGDPILLAVRNDDLLPLVASLPTHRRSDLVFLQNGALREFLADNALATATRGILYVMVAKRGDPGVPGDTSWFCGRHGPAVARWFGALGLPAEDVDWARFSVYELEKLLWLAIFGLLCQARGANVGEIAERYRDEVQGLVDELAPVGRAAWGVDPDRAWLTERLLAYSRAIPEYRASVKEWPWRNGWLVAQARRHGVAIPRHDALVGQLGIGEGG
jgi:ketopantoate reductase